MVFRSWRHGFRGFRIRALAPTTWADLRLLWARGAGRDYSDSQLWLSRAPALAGMDGNRTNPGRLNSAPQTVLKTAEDTSPRSSPAWRTSILAVSRTNGDASRDEIRQRSRRPLPTFLKTAGGTSPHTSPARG